MRCANRLRPASAGTRMRAARMPGRGRQDRRRLEGRTPRAHRISHDRLVRADGLPPRARRSRSFSRACPGPTPPGGGRVPRHAVRGPRPGPPRSGDAQAIAHQHHEPARGDASEGWAGSALPDSALHGSPRGRRAGDPRRRATRSMGGSEVRGARRTRRSRSLSCGDGPSCLPRAASTRGNRTERQPPTRGSASSFSIHLPCVIRHPRDRMTEFSPTSRTD